MTAPEAARAAVFETAPLPLFLLDGRRRIVDANREARRVSRGRDDLQVGKAFVVGGEAKRRILDLAAGSTQAIPFRLDINDASYNAEACRLSGASEPLVLLRLKPAMFAISAFRALRNKMTAVDAASREALIRHRIEKSYEELDRFSAIAAHDLGAPLRQIRMLIGLLSSDLAAKLDAGEIAKLNQISERADRLGELIAGLLAYARAADAPLALQPVDLHEIVEALCEDLAPLIRETGASIEMTTLPIVKGDALLLTLLFQNLVVNAVTYRKPALAPKIRISFHRENGGGEIRIADNGVGVDPAHAERIFDPFMRLRDKEGADGAGMGLAIVKTIAGKHDWRVSMRSVKGDGATVRLQLPPDA